MALAQPCLLRMVVPAGDHGRQRNALEAGIGEGVEDCFGDIGETGRLKISTEDGEQRRLALEDADGVDGDGRDEDGDAHIGGRRADDAPRRKWSGAGRGSRRPRRRDNSSRRNSSAARRPHTRWAAATAMSTMI